MTLGSKAWEILGSRKAKLSTPSIPAKPRRSLVLAKAKYFHGSNKVKWLKKKKRMKASGKWIEFHNSIKRMWIKHDSTTVSCLGG